MKKILIIALSLLLLCGCQTEKTQSRISSDEVLFTGGKKDFTENDLYKVLKLSSLDSISFAIISKISEIEGIDLSEVNEEIEQMADIYLNAGYDAFTVESAKQNWLYSGMLFELAKKHIDDNIDTFLKEDSPIEMQIAYFDSLENAEKALKDIKNGSTFDMACINNGYTGDPSIKVYLDSDESLAFEVKDYINSTDELGLSSIIPSTTVSKDADGNDVETTKYYLLKTVSKNLDDFKDEYYEIKANSFEMNDIIEIYFEKHDIKFYDQDIYEIMTAEYEVLK